MEWSDIEKIKVTKLREMAAEYPDVGPVTGMSKEQLVKLVAKHKGIKRPRLVVSGVNKAEIKKKIRALKTKRDAVLAVHDSVELKKIRRQIHKHKRMLRRSAKLC